MAFNLVFSFQIMMIIFIGKFILTTNGYNGSLDLSNSNLSFVPQIQDSDIEAIDLSRNIISKITRLELSHLKKLKVLDVSYNKLHSMDSDVFHGLHFLEEIDLSFNDLDMSYYGLPKGIFRDQLNSLKVLKLISTGYIHEWPVESLKNLSVLKELYLNLAPAYDQFPSALANLPKLRLLHLRNGYYGSNSKLLSMTKHWIQPLKRSTVEELSFHGCDISSYEYGMFANFSHLQALSFACTINKDIDLADITDALSYLGSTPLNTLVLDQATRKQTILHKHQFCNDIGEKVTRLSVRNNGIAFVQINTLKCLKKIKTLSVGFDPFLPISSYYTNIWDIIRNTLPHTIETIEASYVLTIGFHDIFKNVYCANRIYTVHDHFQTNDVEIDVLPSVHSPKHSSIVSKAGMDVQYSNYSLYFPALKHVYVDNMPASLPLDNIAVFNPPLTIEVFNVSNSGPAMGIFPLFVIYGLHYLRTADLSSSFQNNLKYDLSFLKTLDPYPDYPSLRVLNISGNELSSYSPFFPKLFSNMPALEELDLSKNGIFKLPFNTFTGLGNLRILRISNNLLTMETLIYAQGFHFLHYLDLSYNRISAVQKAFTDVLEKVALAHEITLDISHNPLVCQCSTLGFITWAQITNVTIVKDDLMTCNIVKESGNISIGTQYVKDVDITEVFEDCHITGSNVKLIMLMTVLPMALIFASILLYIKCKVRITVIFYRFRVPKRPDDTSEYHFYILYSEKSDNDRHLVVHFLLPLLKQEGNRVFFNGKDDIPGHDSYEEIYRGITACQKVIAVVSPHLLQDGMCDFALQVAVMELNLQCVCLLIYSDVDVAQIRRQPLKTLVHSRYITCIDINPSDPDNHAIIKDRLKYFALDGQNLQCF